MKLRTRWDGNSSPIKHYLFLKHYNDKHSFFALIRKNQAVSRLLGIFHKEKE